MAEAEARQTIADAAVEFWRRCAATYTYRQHRRYPEGLYAPESRNALDCSSTAILIFKEAGQPDPNNTGFNGTGFTGSLIGQGVRVDSILPGDLIFYGDPFGATGHVTTAVGGGECVSFGSTPISRRAVNYRPIVQVRRYPVLLPEPVVRYYLEERPWSAGGRGPKVLGPWWLGEDPERSRAARDAVLDRMRARHQLAVPMLGRDGKPYIYHYRKGTHGRFPVRRGVVEGGRGARQGPDDARGEERLPAPSVREPGELLLPRMREGRPGPWRRGAHPRAGSPRTPGSFPPDARHE